MKVALYANRVSEPVRRMTGIGTYIASLTAALAQPPAGIDCFVTAPPEPSPPSWLPPAVGYRPCRVPRAVLNSAWIGARRPRIETLVGDFDVLHVLHPAFPVPTRAPACITVHDLLPLHEPGVGRLERVGFRRSIGTALARGWVVVAVSDHVAGQVRALAGARADRVVTAHLGVAPRFFAAGDEAAVSAACRSAGVVPGDFILAVGRISARKNLQVVVEALRRIGPGAPPLVLAGPPGDDSARLARLVDRSGLSGRVHFTGFVDDDVLEGLLRGACLLAHPSSAEGFGLPVVEAMAVGTPVVASDAGSLPEVAGGSALIVPAADVEGWVAAISAVLGDERRRHSLAAAGRERARSFTWEATAAATVAAYRLAAGG